MNAFGELRHYREAMLAVWEAQPAALAAAWHALPAARQAARGAGSPYEALLAFCRWEEAVGFPNLMALLRGEAPRFVLPAAFPAEAPLPAALLASCASRRAEVRARLHALDAAGWSQAGRHPRFGRRTVQWWVERSLAAGRMVLRRLSPEEVSR